MDADTPDPASSTPADARRARAAEQQARAEETLARIFAGGDLGAETLALSNRFTDDTTSRIGRRLRRRRSAAATDSNAADGGADGATD